MSNKLKAITTRAKKLYKTGRYKLWTDAIKAASKQVSKPVRKVSGVKKKAAKKVDRKASHVDKKSHNVKINVVSGFKSSGEVALRAQFERMIQNSLKSIQDLKASNYSNAVKGKAIRLERSKIYAAKKGLAQVNKIITQKLR